MVMVVVAVVVVVVMVENDGENRIQLRLVHVVDTDDEHIDDWTTFVDNVLLSIRVVLE